MAAMGGSGREGSRGLGLWGVRERGEEKQNQNRVRRLAKAARESDGEATTVDNGVGGVARRAKEVPERSGFGRNQGRARWSGWGRGVWPTAPACGGERRHDWKTEKGDGGDGKVVNNSKFQNFIL